jgi:hypothetical protein
MFIETRLTSERSVARLARVSNSGECIRRDGHAITTQLFTFMSYFTSTSFTTTFTDMPFFHRSRSRDNGVSCRHKGNELFFQIQHARRQRHYPRNVVIRIRQYDNLF